MIFHIFYSVRYIPPEFDNTKYFIFAKNIDSKNDNERWGLNDVNRNEESGFVKVIICETDSY